MPNYWVQIEVKVDADDSTDIREFVKNELIPYISVYSKRVRDVECWDIEEEDDDPNTI